MEEVRYFLAANHSTELLLPGRDNSTPTSSHLEPFPKATALFAVVCCVLFIVCGVLGNLATIVALVRCAKLRNATTAFVVSLATADLLFCAINLPPTASRYIHQRWVLGPTLCRLFPFFFYGNVAASLLSMTAITLNRYVLINHHRFYDRIYRPRNVALMVALCWGFSFALLAPTLSGSWGEFGYHAPSFSCTILRKDGRSPKKLLFAVGFLLPCLIIVASYSCIFYRVHKSRKAVEAHSKSGAAGNGPTTVPHRQDEIRLTRMMLIIFCSFLLCFLPLMVVNVLEERIRMPTIHVLASVLAWMSSCVNPIIYAVMNRQYRHAYIRLFCRNKSRHAHSTSSGTGRSGNSRTLMSEVCVFSTDKAKNNEENKI